MSGAGSGRIILIVLVVLAAGIGFMFLPVKEWFALAEGWIESLGPVAPFVFVAAYVVLTVLLIPGSAMTIGAGSVFGLWAGVGLVIVGSNLGALASYLLARTFMRRRVADWAAGNSKFTALDRAIGREGFKVVLLSRLSPIFPFTLLNYLLGLTTIRTGSYLLANVIGMLPGTFLYTYIGAAARDALAGGGRETVLGQVLKYVGLLATLVVVVLITRTARKALAEVESGEQSEERESTMEAG
ncbi:MAG: TVP38/TMEM64 family protein [Blastocatellales bacterium]